MQKQKLPITACLVIYNEEKIIGRALSSIVDLVDEILVVHDGPCMDSSLEIAKHYGATVFVREHCGIAEPHRAWLYGQAKYNWILQIDADEFLSAELQAVLPDLIADNDVNCYELVWPNWDGTKYRTHDWPHKKALFRKDAIQFLALPHCEVIPTGIVKKVPYVLEHRPNYDNVTVESFRNKWMKWVKIHAKFLMKDPSTYARYPEDAAIQVPKYYAIVKHPYLLALPLGIYQGMQSLLSGGYKAGFRGLKTSFFIGLYYVQLAIEVGQLEQIAQKLL